MPPLGMDDKCCNGRSHDLAIALSKLGLLLVYNLCSGLYVSSVTRTLLLFVIIAMNDAIGTTYCQRATPTLDAARKSRKAGRSRGAYLSPSLLLCVRSGSMVVAWMLSSLISTALVSSVAPHPSSHT